MVGVTDYCTFPDEAINIEKIGGFKAPDLEAILSLKPDLLLCTTMHSLEKLKPLGDAGVKLKQVVAENIFDAPQMILSVGEAIGLYKESERLAKTVQEQFESVLLKAKKGSKIKVCYLCTSNPFCSWKPKCQTNNLVEKLGGILTAYNKDNLAQSIVDSDPAVIVIPYSIDLEDYKTQKTFIAENSVFKKTRAYKNNKIVNINGELLSRPGPRAGSGVEQLYNLIHS